MHTHAPSPFTAKVFTVVSNLVYLVPWFVAATVQDATLTVLMPAVFAASTLYHMTKPVGFDIPWVNKKINIQSVLQYLDMVFATYAGIYIMYLFWIKGLPPMFWFMLPIATLALYSFLFWSKENYEIGHTSWHITAALIVTIALLA